MVDYVRPKFEILMATMGKHCVDEIDWGEKNVNSRVLLVNQSDYNGDQVKDDRRMISCLDRGSSRSRNLALDKAKGEICLIADDDVTYPPSVESTIVDAFLQNKDVDIITFQIATPEGQLFNPGYPTLPLRHGRRSILRCASIEIAFRLDSVRDAGLSFDERFGLGSRFRVHDEVIFLKDALDAGLCAKYLPVPIVFHPAESSGTDFTEELLFSKGAAFYRMFGHLAFIMNVFFIVRKRIGLRERMNLVHALLVMLKGSLALRKDS